MDRYGLTLKNMLIFRVMLNYPRVCYLYIYIYIYIFILYCVYIYMYIDGVSTSLALVDPEAASRLLSTGVPPGAVPGAGGASGAASGASATVATQKGPEKSQVRFQFGQSSWSLADPGRSWQPWRLGNQKYRLYRYMIRWLDHIRPY